jgi:glycine hydroxymethyltransferase
MRKLRPNLILLGTASLLFPLPVAEICYEARRLETVSVAYDASNVLGLIAGGQFQDPLADGVDLLFGSTHHTLPGPQGALILTNNFRAASAVSTAVSPTLVNNHHLGRIPGLATALLEMLEFGKVYAAQMVANARALGAEILHLGIPVVAAQKGFTQSHVILLQTSHLDDHKLLAERLEKAGIIVNICHLPHELGDQGLRIGVQEITHQGAMETDMLPIAAFIVDILRGTRTPESVAGSVAEFRKQFQQAYYTFPEES